MKYTTTPHAQISTALLYTSLRACSGAITLYLSTNVSQVNWLLALSSLLVGLCSEQWPKSHSFTTGSVHNEERVPAVDLEQVNIKGKEVIICVDAFLYLLQERC